MTDLEISKALALAIGWAEADIKIDLGAVWLARYPDQKEFGGVPPFMPWCKFDYRDWNVIGPIAERYDAFPFETQSGWESWMTNTSMTNSDTPAKAIALAVIGAKK